MASQVGGADSCREKSSCLELLPRNAPSIGKPRDQSAPDIGPFGSRPAPPGGPGECYCYSCSCGALYCDQQEEAREREAKDEETAQQAVLAAS
jgi:hypothetical protein